MRDLAPAALLDLLQFADSALPVGAQSHSFGLETLIAEGGLTAANLEPLLQDYLAEVGVLEAVFCRGAYALGAEWHAGATQEWQALNRGLSALRPARESRAASTALGRRLLALAADTSQEPALLEALHAAQAGGVACHYVAAFGLTGGVLHLGAEPTLLAYLQQAVWGLLAACQKLLPIGQSELVRMRWRLKASLHAAAVAAEPYTWRTPPPRCALALDLASMRHPGLPVRLFIS
jgi:urease accessory protein